MDGRVLQYVIVLFTSIFVTYMSFITSLQSTSISYYNETSKVWQNRLPSSIWCTYGPSKERLCKFRNICFDPFFREFQFLLTEDSVVSGVESHEDWMNIPLSTVLGHNAFHMKISLLRPGNRNLKEYMYFNSSPTFFIHRFKNDNVMHILHDELIPLHFTFESMSYSNFKFTQQASLAFVDSYKEFSTDTWYKHYSRRDVILLSQINCTVCFADAFSGLLRSTLWFNYGFGMPQGPFKNNQFNVRGIRRFVQHNLLKWNTTPVRKNELTLKVWKAVVIVRSLTRRILNLDSLLDVISKAHSNVLPHQKLLLITLDLAVHNTTYVLSQISDAKLLIGMHGAGMILSLFLPRWASVVELFPFAINPNNVSFLKALTSQPEKYPMHYESWQNKDRKKTHPGSLNNPLLGQISHLPKPKQEEIMSITEVPAVYCCHDPAYLYYMFHDTTISDDVYHSINRAISKYQDEFVLKSEMEFFPSLLTSFSCEVVNGFLLLQWSGCSNQHEIENLWFQVTVQNGNIIMVKNETDSSKRLLQLNLGTVQAEVHGWIQPYNNKVGGHTIHSRCVKK